MNSFESALSNPDLQEKFNQTMFSSENEAEEASQKFDKKLQEIMGPMNEAIDPEAINKEMGLFFIKNLKLNVYSIFYRRKHEYE